MSPGRTLNPDPNAEARERRRDWAKAKKLLREGMARLQAVLYDRFIVDETPLKASDAKRRAADAMQAARPPSVISMLVRLERCGSISRVSGKARAIDVLAPVAHLPPLERPFKS